MLNYELYDDIYFHHNGLVLHGYVADKRDSELLVIADGFAWVVESHHIASVGDYNTQKMMQVLSALEVQA